MTKISEKLDISGVLKQAKKSPHRDGGSNEFEKILQEKNEGVKVSKHATERLKERDISLDGKDFLKIREAMDKIKSKGGRDSLIVSKNTAYIVDVDNQTIVTAMDRKGMENNIFTKIDSTVFID